MTDWNLKKLPGFPGVEGPVLICVMDGVGVGAHDDGDAVWLARTPNLDWLAANTPSCQLVAHGKAVGMPSDDDMGNSEVGHNALGAGRIFDQGAKLVDNAIKDGSMFAGTVWQSLIAHTALHKSTLHFIGLLSDGNVHSHISHLIAMLEHACQQGVQRARVHVLIDGRDVPETSALLYVAQLEAVLTKLRASGADYCVASGGGRMTTTMDRYGADWRIVERGYKTHVLGEGQHFPNLRTAIEKLRDQQPGITDQNLPEFVIADAQGKPVGTIEDGDAVVFFNFRGDRATELCQAFEQDDFEHFTRTRRPKVLFAGMMQYDGDLKIPTHYLVTPPAIDRTLGEYLVHNRVPQLATSETQKYGHVTYFWNGNRSGMFDPAYETYAEVPSDLVPFEQRPWMKAAEITDGILEQLKTGKIRHGRFNYANGDMVGHTGHREAAVTAVQVVDLQIGRLLPVIQKLKGALIVTADHGNADEMFEIDKKKKAFARDTTGRLQAKTSHTLNPVPFYVYAPSAKFEIDASVTQRRLSNVAATSLQLRGLERPEGYDVGLLKG